MMTDWKKINEVHFRTNLGCICMNNYSKEKEEELLKSVVQ